MRIHPRADAQRNHPPRIVGGECEGADMENPPFRADPDSEWGPFADDRELNSSRVSGAALDVPGLLRRLRRVLDLNQRELAEALQVDRATVARWETGQCEPSLSVFQQVMGLAGWRLQVRGDPHGRSDEETPSAHPEHPSTEAEAPSADPGHPTTKADTPSADPEHPTTKADTPNVDQDTPCLEPETPNVDPGTPSLEPETPRMNLETPSADLETPRSEVETPRMGVEGKYGVGRADLRGTGEAVDIAVDADGHSREDVIAPMRPDAVRDKAGRRYPAHLDVIPFSMFAPVPVRDLDGNRCVPRREARDKLRARQAGPPEPDHPTPTGVVIRLEAERTLRQQRRRQEQDQYCDALVDQGLSDPRLDPPCTCPDDCFNEPRCVPGCACRCEDPEVLPPGFMFGW